MMLIFFFQVLALGVMPCHQLVVLANMTTQGTCSQLITLVVLWVILSSSSITTEVLAQSISATHMSLVMVEMEPHLTRCLPDKKIKVTKHFYY